MPEAEPRPVPATLEATEPSVRDAWRAAYMSALWTFLGGFGLSALGWLQAVADWASKGGKVAFPGFSTLGYAVVAAVVAAASALAAFLVRLAQVKGWVPGRPPSYQRKP